METGTSQNGEWLWVECFIYITKAFQSQEDIIYTPLYLVLSELIYLKQWIIFSHDTDLIPTQKMKKTFLKVSLG